MPISGLSQHIRGECPAEKAVVPNSTSRITPSHEPWLSRVGVALRRAPSRGPASAAKDTDRFLCSLRNTGANLAKLYPYARDDTGSSARSKSPVADDLSTPADGDQRGRNRNFLTWPRMSQINSDSRMSSSCHLQTFNEFADRECPLLAQPPAIPTRSQTPSCPDDKKSAIERPSLSGLSRQISVSHETSTDHVHQLQTNTSVQVGQLDRRPEGRTQSMAKLFYFSHMARDLGIDYPWDGPSRPGTAARLEHPRFSAFTSAETELSHGHKDDSELAGRRQSRTWPRAASWMNRMASQTGKMVKGFRGSRHRDTASVVFGRESQMSQRVSPDVGVEEWDEPQPVDDGEPEFDSLSLPPRISLSFGSTVDLGMPELFSSEASPPPPPPAPVMVQPEEDIDHLQSQPQSQTHLQSAKIKLAMEQWARLTSKGDPGTGPGHCRIQPSTDPSFQQNGHSLEEIHYRVSNPPMQRVHVVRADHRKGRRYRPGHRNCSIPIAIRSSGEQRSNINAKCGNCDLNPASGSGLDPARNEMIYPSTIQYDNGTKPRPSMYEGWESFVKSARISVGSEWPKVVVPFAGASRSLGSRAGLQPLVDIYWLLQDCEVDGGGRCCFAVEKEPDVAHLLASMAAF